MDFESLLDFIHFDFLILLLLLLLLPQHELPDLFFLEDDAKAAVRGH